MWFGSYALHFETARTIAISFSVCASTNGLTRSFVGQMTAVGGMYQDIPLSSSRYRLNVPPEARSGRFDLTRFKPSSTQLPVTGTDLSAIRFLLYVLNRCYCCFVFMAMKGKPCRSGPASYVTSPEGNDRDAFRLIRHVWLFLEPFSIQPALRRDVIRKTGECDSKRWPGHPGSVNESGLNDTRANESCGKISKGILKKFYAGRAGELILPGHIEPPMCLAAPRFTRRYVVLKFPIHSFKFHIHHARLQLRLKELRVTVPKSHLVTCRPTLNSNRISDGGASEAMKGESGHRKSHLQNESQRHKLLLYVRILRESVVPQRPVFLLQLSFNQSVALSHVYVRKLVKLVVLVVVYASQWVTALVDFRSDVPVRI
ncbi:hypothetical protein EVAR_15981_1 [Eumeta japonica]|uniref:Uncharacterized protein n=1 Tax=Eumeta variegata TaxID=151549 RepID=A0A4C1UL74_EUMVA|nr:hypothetical protein EVAR_15981_1 [Eumeta japonica]